MRRQGAFIAICADEFAIEVKFHIRSTFNGSYVLPPAEPIGNVRVTAGADLVIRRGGVAVQVAQALPVVARPRRQQTKGAKIYLLAFLSNDHAYQAADMVMARFHPDFHAIVGTMW